MCGTEIRTPVGSYVLTSVTPVFMVVQADAVPVGAARDVSETAFRSLEVDEPVLHKGFPHVFSEFEGKAQERRPALIGGDPGNENFLGFAFTFESGEELSLEGFAFAFNAC